MDINSSWCCFKFFLMRWWARASLDLLLNCSKESKHFYSGAENSSQSIKTVICWALQVLNKLLQWVVFSLCVSHPCHFHKRLYWKSKFSCNKSNAIAQRCSSFSELSYYLVHCFLNQYLVSNQICSTLYAILMWSDPKVSTHFCSFPPQKQSE